jgi:Rrf2 family protein
VRISHKTDYALRTIVHLAQHKDSGVASVAEIAARQGVPRKFLEQILLMLKSAGLVASLRGPKGGYCLAVSPSRITLASIIRLTESDFFPKSEAENVPAEAPGSACLRAFEELWLEISSYVAHRLDEVTVQDFCERLAALTYGGEPDYMI